MIDLLVAGGGPAGLATALNGARAGLEVVVVERREGVLDKACGEGLMPHTLRYLSALGVAPRGRTLRGIRYRDGARQVEAPFRSGSGRGVRRTVLHQGLLDAAQAAGVRFEYRDIGDISQDAESVCAAGFRARYLAAADGLHSPIRTQLGLSIPSKGPRRWGIRRHIEIPPWSDLVEVHWAAGSEAYVTPSVPAASAWPFSVRHGAASTDISSSSPPCGNGWPDIRTARTVPPDHCGNR